MSSLLCLSFLEVLLIVLILMAAWRVCRDHATHMTRYSTDSRSPQYSACAYDTHEYSEGHEDSDPALISGLQSEPNAAWTPASSFSDPVNESIDSGIRASAAIGDSDIWDSMYGTTGTDWGEQDAMDDELQLMIAGEGAYSDQSMDKKIIDKAAHQMRAGVVSAAIHARSNFVGHVQTTSTRSHENWWGA